MTDSFTFTPIATVRSCYREKFGVPRQPGLVPVEGYIDILPAYSREEAFRGLEAFSHIWVLFVFNQTRRSDWKATVRPPRLGGNERVGVFASRSMFRPNSLGQSAVRLKRVETGDAGVRLVIEGGDFVDGTPVVDIKPYLAWADSYPDAQGAYAQQAPEPLVEVVFLPEARTVIERYSTTLPELENTLQAVLGLDPRPAYRASETDGRQVFAMRLYDFDVRWRVEDTTVTVFEITDSAE